MFRSCAECLHLDIHMNTEWRLSVTARATFMQVSKTQNQKTRPTEKKVLYSYQWIHKFPTQSKTLSPHTGIVLAPHIVLHISPKSVSLSRCLSYFVTTVSRGAGCLSDHRPWSWPLYQSSGWQDPGAGCLSSTQTHV